MLQGLTAGMPRRSFAEYSGYVAGRTVARRGENVRTVFNEAVPVSRYAGARRYKLNRFYQGRGVRSGSYMYRRFRGLRTYPQSGIETKFFDSYTDQTALAAPPATQAWTGMELNPATGLAFNCPTQGTGASNREGRLITMESLQITGNIYIANQVDQTAMDSMPTIRLWVVLDRQTNGGTATGLDSELVFDNPGQSAVTGINPLRNMLYSKRFKVLKEIDVEIKALNVAYDGTNMEQGGIVTPFDCFVKLKGMKTEFLGNAGTRADIVTNGLFLVGLTSSTQTAPKISYNARLRFRG